ERTRLTELWLAATEGRAEVLIELEELDAATADLRRLVAEHPLRERPRALLMRALYRVGRQADALQVYADTRRLLKVELGIPAGPDVQAALYRSLLAGRRMAVVLDNAASTDQVQPLLPGSPTCLVVITSRQRLSGLVALQGAHPLTVDVLPPHQARRQLASHVGAARLAAEPDAADDVVASCAGLPLALAIVAARVAARPA